MLSPERERGRDGQESEISRLVLDVAIGVILIVQAFWASYTRIEVIPYSTYRSQLKAGAIESVRVSGNYIQGKFERPDDKGYSEFVTTRVDPRLAEDLEKYHVRFSGAIESNFLRNLLSWIIPTALFFGIWIFLYRRFAEQRGFGGLMAIGRGKAKVYVETDTKTRFADVAGCSTPTNVRSSPITRWVTPS